MVFLILSRFLSFGVPTQSYGCKNPVPGILEFDEMCDVAGLIAPDIYRLWNKYRTISIDGAYVSDSISASYKMSEFFEKSPLSGVEKHGDLQVTSCLQNVSAHTNFARSESEKMLVVC